MLTPSEKIHLLFFPFISDVEDDESSESKGEDGQDLDLEGIFDNVPLDNSDLAQADNLMLDDLEAENLPFSPLIDMPPAPAPASPPPPVPTQITVAANVHHSPNLELDLDETPTGWHVSYR